MKHDTAPGNYYVSVVDHIKRPNRTGLLAGPFVDDHAAALAMVDRARAAAYEHDKWAWFYAFGTVRMPKTYTRLGLLNKELGLS